MKHVFGKWICRVSEHASFALRLSHDHRQVWPSWMKRRHWWMSWRDGQLNRAAYWRPNRPRLMQPFRKSPSPCRFVFVRVFICDVCKPHAEPVLRVCFRMPVTRRQRWRRSKREWQRRSLRSKSGRRTLTRSFERSRWAHLSSSNDHTCPDHMTAWVMWSGLHTHKA